MENREKQADFQRNLEWWQRVQQVIPSGCSTLAKTPNRLFPGYTPVCCAAAQGAHFTDLDGNVWLDCEMAMGTASWGHARDEIQAAVIEQLAKGTNFSIPADIELTCAELILERFGGRYAALRFSKSGADAVSGAVRLARAYTRKPQVLATSYHGWHDWSAYGFYGQHTEALGIPPEVADSTIWVANPTTQLIRQAVLEHGQQLACVVLCPNEWDRQELLSAVQACREHHILVVFDEVTSGIRMGRQATAGEYDIWPDLLCISKGMAGGLPLAAVLGSEALMRLSGDVKFSNAHSSETIALAAAVACEKLMQAAPVWPSWRSGAEAMMDRLRSELERLALTPLLVLKGTYASFCIRSRDADDFYRDGFREFMVKRLAAAGIFSKGFFIFSDSHTSEDLNRVEASLMKVLQEWQESTQPSITKLKEEISS